MALNTAVILAAGAGTRMKSKLPKVLHEVCGKSMAERVISEVKASDMRHVIVVIGNGADQVKQALDPLNVTFALQEEQLGTGHAVRQAESHIPDEGNVIVLCGDMPLIKKDTIMSFLRFHEDQNDDISVLTAKLENPFGYGRIIKDTNGKIEKIVEEKDANDCERQINEINSGVYLFKTQILKKYLKEISNDNAQGEYYLPDIIEIGMKKGNKIGTYLIENADEIMGVNSRKQLAEAESIMRKWTIDYLMNEGVTFIDPTHTYIDDKVRIGMDTIVYPGTVIKGNTVIGDNCMIGQDSRIEDSRIEDAVQIQSSVIVDSYVKSGTTIGPFAYLRPGSQIGKNVKIGDFVEIKNSIIGDGTKASHLAYVGDAEVGSHVNIGCGVIFVNYDGKNKNKIIVEDNAFIGSNVNLVAPVTVKKEAFVAAGTTVTLEVPEGTLCIGREKQRHIRGWVDRKKRTEEI